MTVSQHTEQREAVGPPSMVPRSRRRGRPHHTTRHTRGERGAARAAVASLLLLLVAFLAPTPAPADAFAAPPHHRRRHVAPPGAAGPRAARAPAAATGGGRGRGRRYSASGARPVPPLVAAAAPPAGAAGADDANGDDDSNDDSSAWLSRGLLLSSFTDGLRGNPLAQRRLRRDLLRALLARLQRAAEGRVAASARCSPCCGPDLAALDRLERLDEAMDKLDEDDYRDSSEKSDSKVMELLRAMHDELDPGHPFCLRLLFIPTAMYALRPDSTSAPGKQRQRARADAKSRRDALVALLRDAVLPGVPVHVVTHDLADGSLKQPQGSDGPWDFPTSGREAFQEWQPHMVYVQGGNTFWLYHCLHEQGWRDDLMGFCRAGAGVYVGASAGAILVGASMEVATWKGWDDPRVVPGRETPEDWAGVSGLGLVGPHAFFPHMEDQWADLVREKSATLSSPPICLRDGDACFVDGATKSLTIVHASANMRRQLRRR